MVKRMSSIAQKGSALATGVVVLVLSSLNFLTIGFAIILLGRGLAPLALDQCKEKSMKPSVDINHIPDDALMLR